MTRDEALKVAEQALVKAEAATARNTSTPEWTESFSSRSRALVRIAYGYIDLARELDKPKPVR